MTEAMAYDEGESAYEGQGGSGLLTLNGTSQPAKFHPLAQVFPMIEGEAFAALVADVRANGVRRPVVMFEGMILDGRNRYMAAREAEVGFAVVEFTGPNPVAFVISENLRRRHLTDAQRVMAAKRLETWKHGENQHTGGDANVRVLREDAAALLNVSPRSVSNAGRIIDHGAPSLVAAVDAGEITISAAAEVARLPEATQAQVVADGPEAVRETAKAIREDSTVVDRVKAGATVAEAKKQKPVPADAEPVDPERRQIAKLTQDAMIDEIVGLRADLRESKDKNRALKDENTDLKAKLAEATSSDLGKALGNAQRRLDTVTGRMNEHQAEAARLGYKLKKAEARVAELEAMPVSMS